MINDTTNTATGEPVTEQAPAVDTTSTTQATPAAPGLPDGYLSGATMPPPTRGTSIFALSSSLPGPADRRRPCPPAPLRFQRTSAGDEKGKEKDAPL